MHCFISNSDYQLYCNCQHTQDGEEAISIPILCRIYHPLSRCVLQMPDDLDTSSIDSKDVDKFMRLYFDLFSEEYYLHSKGVIDNKVWGLWVDGISIAMNKQKYKTAWKLLGSYYDDENFVHFMNNLAREKV